MQEIQPNRNTTNQKEISELENSLDSIQPYKLQVSLSYTYSCDLGLCDVTALFKLEELLTDMLLMPNT